MRFLQEGRRRGDIPPLGGETKQSAIPEKTPAPANLNQDEFMKWAEAQAPKGKTVGGVYHSPLTDEDYYRYSKIKAGVAQAADDYKAEPGITHAARSYLQGVAPGWEPQITGATAELLYGMDPDTVAAGERAKLAQYSKDRPIASLASQGAGGATSLALTGAGEGAANLLSGIPNAYGRAAATASLLGAPIAASEEMADRGVSPENALRGGVKGAVGGVILGPAFEVAGRGLADTVAPWTSEKAQYLINQGIPLTSGQTLGGLANWFEGVASKSPFTSGLVRRTLNNAEDELNAVGIQRSLTPIGESLPANLKSGNEAINYAHDKLSDRYDNLLPHLTLNPRNDRHLGNDVSGILADADEILPPDQMARLNKIVEQQIWGKADKDPNGILDGDQLKVIESVLGRTAASTRKGNGDDVELSGYIRKLQSALRDSLERQNPGYGSELKAVNTGWANLVRVENAAGRAGNIGGHFNPTALDAAVKWADPSARKADYSRGRALMQDLSGPAKEVMVPNSRNGAITGGSPTAPLTASMRFLDALAKGGPAAATALKATGLSILGGTAVYNPITQSLIRTAAAQSPQTRNMIAEAIRNATPAASTYVAPNVIPTNALDSVTKRMGL
jgi:hypothetical protein